MRRIFPLALALAAVVAVTAAPAALAHHGVIFTDDEEISITGEVVKPLTGNPHFEIQVQDGDTRWAIDLGNPYRIKRAGLAWNGSDMPVGRTITVEGFPALIGDVIEARTIWIDNKPHRLFDEDEPRY